MKLVPGNATALRLLAESHLVSGDTADAMAVLKEALEADPLHAPALVRWSLQWMSQRTPRSLHSHILRLC